ncbi:L-histidine N(alpha)-methyltransferase [Changchengzhania lutea]|uniref:L-histidine N(alpha)-methyltransferase n=1 Tax=Changchengzhania lutea TaxID=2049305 RepID=UPI00163DC6AF|nr:L-histidine N(alpha)-methyltransferase [Changchengzhania lutea]
MAILWNQTREIAINDSLRLDVDQGLSAQSKFLSSKYFYNEKGDALFVKIMNLPEYYLTRAEFDIFQNQTEALIKALKIDKEIEFDLIELGAGDGTKTKELLKLLKTKQFQFTYIPIDISQNALDKLEISINTEHPNINVHPKRGDYFHVLEDLATSKKPKVILFLGSNIGNLNDEEAHVFMENLDHALHSSDKLVLGLDLIKSENIVLPAYNDAQGVTRAFNMNLLERINEELDADFDISCFVHEPEYNENEGIARSYIKSTKPQTVTVKALDKTFFFREGECIHTETSRKYNDAILNSILKNTSMEITDKLTDSNNYFADYILNKT